MEQLKAMISNIEDSFPFIRNLSGGNCLQFIFQLLPLDGWLQPHVSAQWKVLWIWGGEVAVVDSNMPSSTTIELWKMLSANSKRIKYFSMFCKSHWFYYSKRVNKSCTNVMKTQYIEWYILNVIFSLLLSSNLNMVCSNVDSRFTKKAE